MKLRILAIITILVVLATSVLGCEEHEVSKTTGGGWFEDSYTGAKVTFGFSAIPTVDDPEDPYGIWDLAKGQFQLIDHSAKIKVHGTFEWAVHNAYTQSTDFWGLCTVNGIDDNFYYEIMFWDEGDVGPNKGDGISIDIWGDSADYHWLGELEGGNIRVHSK